MEQFKTFIDIVSSPNVAFVLLMLGIYGIIFEFTSPGAIIPGVIGAFSLISALAGLFILKANFVGLFLILLAVAFFISEIKVVSYGSLTIAGILIYIYGSFLLFKSNPNGLKVSMFIIAAFALLTAAFFLFVISAGMKAQKRKVVTGISGLIGDSGVVRQEINPSGMIFISGALWRAVSVNELTIKEGKRVKVIEVEGLTLVVEPLEED